MAVKDPADVNLRNMNQSESSSIEGDPSERLLPSTKPSVPCFVYILVFFSAIGDFRIGYDKGVISGAMILLAKRFSLGIFQQELVVSILIGSAAVFAIIGAFLNECFGRKPVILLASFLFTTGSVVLAFAVDINMLLIGRSIAGAGIGLTSMTIPVYLAECAPANIRGRLVTIGCMFGNMGQFVANCMDGTFSFNKTDGWRYMLGLAVCPSLLLMCGFVFLPESPRWLISKGRDSDALSALQKIRVSGQADDELHAIKHSVDKDLETRALTGDRPVIIQMLCTPHVRRALVLGCLLHVFQQISGINTIMYYSATIIKMVGIQSDRLSIWLAAGTVSINFAFTMTGLLLVERIGRRPLTLGSLAGSALSMALLALAFQVASHKDIPVTMTQNVEKILDNTTDTLCNSYSSCKTCMHDKDCGFCYQQTGAHILNSSCLPAYDISAMQHSGMSPMPWTINAEIYPLWARSMGNALATTVNWILNLLISITFLTLTETLNRYGAFWFYSGFSVVGVFTLAWLLPETKGLKLEDVDKLFT